MDERLRFVARPLEGERMVLTTSHGRGDFAEPCSIEFCPSTFITAEFCSQIYSVAAIQT